MNRRSVFAHGLALFALIIISSPGYAGSTTTLKSLMGKTHFHGIAVHPIDPERFYLATHHGFFLVSPDGNAKLLSDNSNDYMGFTPHPTDQKIFYASGHPTSGGNTGFIQSTNGGRTWKQLSPGVGGPVDFHQMDVSSADPNLIYGVFRGLQISEDGGNRWKIVAQVPPGLIDLAASGKDTQTLYAATQNGLLISRNRGISWQPAHLKRSPASMVQAAGDGSVYAFVGGLGLIRSPDDSMRWALLNNDFGDAYLLHLAVDNNYPDILYAISNKSEVLSSRDGGLSWSVFK
ncbi:MAG: photosystem II stability/assembly factor-like uncharacterized protein [Planctomycetota bacterium]|jgi:photosystem II stability/assembly factor-like uncharacterized protein